MPCPASQRAVILGSFFHGHCQSTALRKPFVSTGVEYQPAFLISWHRISLWKRAVISIHSHCNTDSNCINSLLTTQSLPGFFQNSTKVCTLECKWILVYFQMGQLFINLCSSSSWQLWAALSSDANAGKPGCKGLQGYIHSHGGEYIYRGYKSEGTKL